MNSDHRDPLHDSRNAMTEWERSLRPTRERHWAMRIALSALLFDAHVKWIDTMARQPQGAAMQDWLRNERQQARDRRFRLGCR